MLKRRNTIHPGQQLYTKIHPLDRHRHHSPATPSPSSSSTNPFLSSSLDDLTTLIPKHSQHRYHQQQQPLSADITNNSKPNPFLYDTRAYNPFSSQDAIPVDHCLQQQQQQDYRHPFREQHDDSHLNPTQQQSQPNTTNNNHAKDLHKRRMSLDVFKVPFNLNRGRRATCAASDLKRMLTIKTSAALNKRQQKKVEDYVGGDSDVSELNRAQHDGGDTDEILKTSKYLPDEQVVDYQGEDDGGQQFQDVQEGHAAKKDKDGYQDRHQQGRHQNKHGAVEEESYNPFVQHHNNRTGQSQEGMTLRPFDSAPEQNDAGQNHQHFQATSRPSDADGQNPTSLTRRRYSVFSDWSIEDCPRLLAMQQRQQQQQREEQEQLEQQYQDASTSQTLLTRSKTDTSLSKNYDIPQYRRHIAATHTSHPSPVSPTPTTPQTAAAATAATQRPRRNTVILGKNLIRSAGPNHRRPNPETSSLKSISRNVGTTDAYAASPQHRQQGQQQQHEHEHVYGQQQQRRQPVGRPESSHSYKHDFLKDTARWKPHPWTAASSSHSYSSVCSSPSSPLHQSRFPHELERENEEADGSSSGDDRDRDSESDDDDDGEVDGRNSGMKVVEGGWKNSNQGEAYLQKHSRRHSGHTSSRRQSLVHERGRQRQRQSTDASDAHSYRSLPVTTAATRRPKAEPLYHDMKAIQMRPYGHEDDDDDEGDDDGYSKFKKYSKPSQEEDSSLQEQGYGDGTGNCYGYYDELTPWHNQQNHYDQWQHQPDAAADGYYESPSSSAASFLASAAPSSNKARSQDSLSKKASLAKAKFYKYLNKSSSTSNPHRHHPLDSGSSDLETACHPINHHGYYGVEDDEQHDNSHHFGSGYSFTSSLRARVRLTRTKTVLRQVKRRLSEAFSEATAKAASTLKNDLHLGKRGASPSQEQQQLAEAFRQDYGDGYEQRSGPDTIGKYTSD